MITGRDGAITRRFQASPVLTNAAMTAASSEGACMFAQMRGKADVHTDVVSGDSLEKGVHDVCKATIASGCRYPFSPMLAAAGGFDGAA